MLFSLAHEAFWLCWMHAGHPSSVDAMVAFDADTVLTGSADGLIRIIGILPNAMLGLVGEHAQARRCRPQGWAVHHGASCPVPSCAVQGEYAVSSPVLTTALTRRSVTKSG